MAVAAAPPDVVLELGEEVLLPTIAVLDVGLELGRDTGYHSIVAYPDDQGSASGIG
jgi:hypothetical protein